MQLIIDDDSGKKSQEIIIYVSRTQIEFVKYSSFIPLNFKIFLIYIITLKVFNNNIYNVLLMQFIFDDFHRSTTEKVLNLLEWYLIPTWMYVWYVTIWIKRNKLIRGMFLSPNSWYILFADPKYDNLYQHISKIW